MKKEIQLQSQQRQSTPSVNFWLKFIYNLALPPSFLNTLNKIWRENKDFIIQLDSALLDFDFFLWLLEPTVGMVPCCAQVTRDLWAFSVQRGSISWPEAWLGQQQTVQPCSTMEQAVDGCCLWCMDLLSFPSHFSWIWNIALWSLTE